MRILIVGGGIAGLSMARALRLRGIDSEILSTAGAPAPNRLVTPSSLT